MSRKGQILVNKNSFRFLWKASVVWALFSGVLVVLLIMDNWPSVGGVEMIGVYLAFVSFVTFMVASLWFWDACRKIQSGLVTQDEAIDAMISRLKGSSKTA